MLYICALYIHSNKDLQGIVSHVAPAFCNIQQVPLIRSLLIFKIICLEDILKVKDDSPFSLEVIG